MDIIASIDAATDTATKILGLLHGARRLFSDKNKELALAIEGAQQLKADLSAARNAVFLLEEENRALKQGKLELQRLLEQREAATLEQVAPGTYAYVLTEVADAVKNGPWYCQTCFDAHKKAVFKFERREFGFDVHQCPLCGSQIKIPNDVRMQFLPAPPHDPIAGY